MAGPVVFSDIQKKAKPTLTQAGTLHKGGAKGTSIRRGWQGGDELPYFRLELDPRWEKMPWSDGSGRSVAAVIRERLENIPGWPEPKSLRVRFPFSTLENNKFWRNDAWVTGKSGQTFCTYRCDGEKMLLETIDGPNGKPMAVKNPRGKDGQPKPCAAIQGYDPETGQPIMADKCPNGCTSKLTTTVILVDLGLEMGWTLTTTATTDFYAFEAALAQYDGYLNADGLIFTWTRVEEFIPDGNGSRTRCWPIKIELDPSSSAKFWRQREQRIMEALADVDAPAGVEEFAMLGGDDLVQDVPAEGSPPASMGVSPPIKSAGERNTMGYSGDSQVAVTAPKDRAAEVTRKRKAAKPEITTDQVKAWIEDRTRSDEYDQIYSHPSRLTNGDYLDLLSFLELASV